MLAGEFRKEQLYISDANIVDSLRGGTSLSHSGISPAEVKACRARHKTHAAKTHRRADKKLPLRRVSGPLHTARHSCETKYFTEVNESMARISGVDLPRDKRVEIGLTYIYGIGRKTAQDILSATGVNPDTRVRDLSEDDVSKLREYIDHNVKVEGDLRRETSMNIKRLIEIGCYRGVRHRKGLPVRGQSTKQNARTRKGPKRSVGGRKK